LLPLTFEGKLSTPVKSKMPLSGLLFSFAEREGLAALIPEGVAKQKELPVASLPSFLFFRPAHASLAGLQNKNALIRGQLFLFAEREGFEPSIQV
jgi:hypothetical protein